MYEAHFGLSEPAFPLTPDPRFLWLSETHREGLATLIYGIERRKGFLLLTGEVGSGKTTLLRAALDRLPGNVDVGLLQNTADLSGLALLKLVAAEFGVQTDGLDKADVLIRLSRIFLEQLRRGRNTVLIVDEAQNLGRDALEEIRLLSNLETDREKLVQIVLTGQPELYETLSKPNLRQLRQRIAVEHQIELLRPEEVRPYLEPRINVAGGEYDEVFEAGCEALFYSASGGCPRLISLLADRSLLSAFSKGMPKVTREVVELKMKSSVFQSQPPVGPEL